jgi:mono/diheme cytochrome c family protein
MNVLRPTAIAVTWACAGLACSTPPAPVDERRQAPEASASVPRERELFENACGVCHGADGHGKDGQSPPVRDSPFVRGDAGVLIRIVLDGIRSDEAEREGLYVLPMPGWRVLDDRDVASIATRVREAWGSGASAVAADEVARVREATRDRDRPWRREELLPLLGGSVRQ